MEEYFLSEMFMSTVEKPANFMLDIQAYTLFVSNNLLGEENPEGLEEIADSAIIHYMAMSPEDVIDYLQEEGYDIEDIEELFDDDY